MFFALFSFAGINAQGDTFGAATPITPSAPGTGCGSFTFSYDATLFTDSGMDGSCNGANTGFDVFYSWTATTDALIWNDGDGNPGIVIWDAIGMTEITCEQTFAGIDAQLSGWTVGQDLIIQVYDFGTAQVNPTTFCLEEFTIPPPPSNDNCAGVIDLGGETSPLTATTNQAVNDFGQDCLTNAAAPDVVYSILVPDGSTIEIGQTSNSYDSKHRLAYGGSCPGDTLIICTDDPDTQTESWTNTTGSDQTLYWVQSAFSTGSGDFTLEWNVFACTQPSATYTVVDDCAGSGGFFIDVDVTDLGSATSLTISDDQGSPTQNVVATGVVQFGPYVNNTDVVISVANDQDGQCTISSGALTQTACPPANDDFANAIALNCNDNVTGSTALATLDEDDAPDGFGADMDAPNVWYTYTGSGTVEDVTLDLCPSSYDTSVLIYTGTSGNLTIVGGNDDNGAVCTSGTRSYTTFTSDGTTTYYIAVEGWNASSTGAYDLTLTCAAACTPAQANQDCASAVAAVVDGNAFTVDNTCSTLNATQPSCDSFQSIADVWYTFVAPVGGEVEITSVLGTATAAHMAVYSGTCGALVEEGCSSATTGSLSLTGLIEGNTYYLQLWNNGSEEGTFDVTITDTSLSIDDLDNPASFTFYPNPVTSTLTLNAQSIIENVVMYNMLGQEVMRAAPNALDSELDMSNLQTGTYFIQVSVANAIRTIRVLKQ